MPCLHWTDLKTTDFAGLDPSAVALLPVGAVEQHGPHLPVAVDMTLASHMAQEAAQRAGATVLLLPTQSYGKSDEHLSFPGTLTLGAETLLDTLVQIGHSVARGGLRRIVFLNAHGGNVPVLAVACRRLRVEAGMLAVTAGWVSMGFPDGLVSAREQADGIHAGFVETSAMLHFHPDLVDMGQAQDFVPASRAVMEDSEVLRLLGPVSAGWVAQDLHPLGAAGNAAAATAEAGARIVAHAAARYATLLDEVSRHPADLEPTG